MKILCFFLCPQRIGIYSGEKAKDQVIIFSFLKQSQTNCQKYYYYCCYYYSTIKFLVSFNLFVRCMAHLVKNRFGVKKNNS